MKNKTLLRTNILVCLIIIIGFAITSFISYKSNVGIYEKDVEQVSGLTSEGIYNEITSIFSKPINVSLTMANDSLLKKFLSNESENMLDDNYLAQMKTYLNDYREKYDYDSVFLVSSESNRYYHFNGIDRTLLKDDPENVWYYNFLESEDEYSLNVDNDQATKTDTITVFVNCKIKDKDDKVLGVVGVGLKVDSLQSLLMDYELKYGIYAYLVDNNGKIEISTDTTGYENVNLFDIKNYIGNKSIVLENSEKRQTFWYEDGIKTGCVVTRYEPNLKWHLVVENDTTIVNQQLSKQLKRNVFIIFAIIVLVLITITTVIKKYNAQIIELTISQELEYQKMLHETTEELYESIYEINITHNCAGGEGTKKYFESLGMNENTPYDDAIRIIADKQIKDEYIKGYLEAFSRENVISAYEKGINNLGYDFMISTDGQNYHWVKIVARIFFWNSDKSIRMITYRKNIDDDKKRELMLLEKVQIDAMTGIYNKATTEKLITQTLQEDLNKNVKHAFLILDIDNFKNVNDTMGHNFGDHVIKELAESIKRQFKEYDIVGRIGGDEYVILVKNINDSDLLKQKLPLLCARFKNKNFGIKEEYYITCSIGVAVFKTDGLTYTDLYEKADQALYYAKGHGKGTYCIFDEETQNKAFQSNQRDIETLLNIATDGIAKIACTNPPQLLYFNEKCVDLTGVSSEILSTPNYDTSPLVHPDDLPIVIAAYKNAMEKKEQFDVVFRLRKATGEEIKVKTIGIFINELYEKKYPIFYALYLIINPNKEI